MANWPNNVEQVTEERFLETALGQVLGSDDVQDLVLDNLTQRVEALTHMLYPEPVTLGDALVDFNEGLSGGVYHLTPTVTASKHHGAWRGHIITLEPDASPWLDFANADGSLETVPYLRAAGRKYYIGTRRESYPSAAPQAYGGTIAFKEWRQAMGFSGDPNSVTDGGGSITFNLNDVASFANYTGGGAWPNHASIGRQVVIWKNQPEVASGDAVFYGTALSNGTNVTVTVPHTFGQSTVSTTASDYTVLVLGLVIAPDTYSLVTQGFWVMGSVTDGVVDNTDGQSTATLPGTFGLNLVQLAKDIYYEPSYSLDGDGNANLADPPGNLQQMAIRMLHRWGRLLGTQDWMDTSHSRTAGLWMGNAEAFYDLIGDCSVYDESGNDVTFTFPALSGRAWAKVDGVMGTAWESGFNVSTLPEGSTGAPTTYYITLAATTETEGAYNVVPGDTGKGELRVVIAPFTGAAPTFDGTSLPLLKFDYVSANAGEGASPFTVDTGPSGSSRVQNIQIANLYAMFRGLFGEGMGVHGGQDVTQGRETVLGDTVRCQQQSTDVFVDDVPATELVRPSHSGADEMATTTYRRPAGFHPAAVAGQLAKLHDTDWTNAEVIYRIYGTSGSAGIQTGEDVWMEFGDGSDFGLRFYEDSGGKVMCDWGKGSGSSATKWMRLRDNGGTQANAVDSVRGALEVPDLRLLGSQGKVIVRPVNIVSGSVQSGGWSFETIYGRWDGPAGAGNILRIMLEPPPQAGPNVEGLAGSGAVGTVVKLVGVKIWARVYGSAAGDGIDASVVEVDGDPATAGESTITGMTDTTTWRNTASASAWLKSTTGSTDGDSLYDGWSIDHSKTYHVKLETQESSSLTDVKVWAVTAAWRIYDLT